MSTIKLLVENSMRNSGIKYGSHGSLPIGDTNNEGTDGCVLYYEFSNLDFGGRTHLLSTELMEFVTVADDSSIKHTCYELNLSILMGMFITPTPVNSNNAKNTFFKYAKSAGFPKAVFVTIPPADELVDASCDLACRVSSILALDVNNSGYKSIVINRDMSYQVYSLYKSNQKKNMVESPNLHRKSAPTDRYVEVAPAKPRTRDSIFINQPQPNIMHTMKIKASAPTYQNNHGIQEMCDTGYITTFFKEKGFGFISPADKDPNSDEQTFFHIKNVTDPELVEMLEESLPDDLSSSGIEVKYTKRRIVGKKYDTAIEVF